MNPNGNPSTDASAEEDGRFVARLAAGVLVLLAGARGALLDTGLPDVVEFLLGAATGAFVVGVLAAVLRAAASMLRPVPAKLLGTVLLVVLVLLVFDEWSVARLWRTLLAPEEWAWPLALPGALSVPALSVIVLALVLVPLAVRRGRRDALALVGAPGGLALFTVAGGLAVLAFAIVVALARDGRDPYPVDFRTLADSTGGAVDAPPADPSAPGRWQVETLSYGAGPNPRRPAFADARDLESRTVDAADLLPEWKGVRGRMRERYWGFGLDAAPLDGLVWAPEAPGPRPLVLVVHGNHGMEDYSDPGYAYLGELLASRGYIVVSVDENYINGSWSGDFRGKEMALRAWLLLEHLRLWRDWADTPGHPFEGRVDLSRIALVGHSRGGEAVSIAHAFNELPRHPDDATIPFDYGFDIRALVAIAQVDQRYHRRVELADVDFLALQGSYDADEPAFHGLRQFNRIALTPGTDHFKAGLYVHRANHGQFNSTWGRADYGPPGAWLLNLAPIMPPEHQRRIAAVYVSAFLDASLRGDAAARALLRDPRRGAAFLPDEIYVQQYTDASFVPVATFEEDLDVSSATASGATIATEDLALWREEELLHRDGREQGTDVAVLGWRKGTAPVFRVRLPEGLPVPHGDGNALLTLAIAASPERAPGDDDAQAEEDATGTAAAPAPAQAGETGADGETRADGATEVEDSGGPAFELELVTASGRIARVSGRDIAALAPPLHVRYLKSASANAAAYRSTWEAVLQTLEVPLDRFALAPGEVRELRLRFDGTNAGAVIVDELGVRASP